MRLRKQMKQLKSSDLKGLRAEILAEQAGICPLCEQQIAPEDAVVDHDHDTGLVRGVLHSVCNSVEGMIKHKFRRGGVHKKTDLITYLKNLVVYLEKEQYELIHPSEKPKEPNLMKSSFNELVREMKKNKYTKKLPEYPKSKKMTKGLKVLFEVYKIKPKFHKLKGKRG